MDGDPFVKYLVWRARGLAPAHAFDMGPMRAGTRGVCLYAPRFEDTEQVSSKYRKCHHCERHLKRFSELMKVVSSPGAVLAPGAEVDWFGEG